MADASSNTFQADFCAERLKALGDPVRLRIVELLLYGELSVGDIAAFLEVEVVNISHHLQILKHAQLVIARREGRFIYYQLDEALVRSKQKSRHTLDLGCCRLEVAKDGK